MPSIDHYARDAEPSGVDRRTICILLAGSSLFEEIFDQIFKPGIVPSRETSLKEGAKGAPFLLKQSKVAFCATHVPGQNHWFFAIRLPDHGIVHIVGWRRDRVNERPWSLAVLVPDHDRNHGRWRSPCVALTKTIGFSHETLACSSALSSVWCWSAQARPTPGRLTLVARKVAARLKPNSLREFANLMEQEILPWLRTQEGFLDLITLAVPASREVAIISFWDHKGNVQAYNPSAYPEVWNTLARVLDGTPYVKTFDVVGSTFQGAAFAQPPESDNLSEQYRG